MLTKPATKRTTLIFFALTLGLSAVNYWLGSNRDHCEVSHPESESEVKQSEKGADILSDDQQDRFYLWLFNRTRSFLSPTLLKLEAACPATVAPEAQFSTDHPDSSDGDSEYMGSVAVLGEVQLHIGESTDVKAAMWKNMSQYLQGTSAVITSLSSSLEENSKHPSLLRDLGSIGDTVIVSLANSVVPGSSSSDKVARKLTRSLEWAGIEWLGVNAKKHYVMVMGNGNGERFGVLAFCGVPKECTDNPKLAFYPVKYSQKTAKSAIEDLNQHGVKLILVLMNWGLEASYFPEETALTQARYLARLGVSAVIGFHPSSIQHHSYFGKTLVIFSTGKMLSSSQVSHHCWRKDSSEKWTYSSSKACHMIHPQNRDNLLTKEHQSRIYKLKLSRSRPVVADYTTLPLLDHRREDGTVIRTPKMQASHVKWTRACSSADTHCISCIPF